MIPDLKRFTESIDNASLVFFRIAYGAMMVVEIAYEYFAGNLEHVWADPVFHFTYAGFGWLPAWSGSMMYVHFAFTACCALLVAIGLWYRISIVLFFLSYSYIFLLEQGAFQNHLYLFCLLGFVLALLPAERALSVDVWRGRVKKTNQVGAWAVWLIRFQIGIVYFFGGVAKLNADWFNGEPIRMWLARRADFAIIGPYVHEEWLVHFFSYGGLLFDLLIVPLLLWKKTRSYAYVAVIFFNATNAFLFKIGPFPWVMLLASLMFFEPEWPRTLFGGLFARRSGGRHSKIFSDEVPRPDSRVISKQDPGPARRNPWGQRVFASVVISYVLVQMLVPLRAFVYPGNPGWTEEGHFFSWRMMLRDKRVTAALLVAHDPESGQNSRVRPAEYMEAWQSRIMFRNPELVRQFAWYLAEDAGLHGLPVPQIHARIMVSMNGRSPTLLVDPTVNLAVEPRTIAHARWIEPEPPR